MSRSLSLRRRTALWWGVAALLMQILVPLGQAAPAWATDAEGLSGGLVVCTTQGLRTMAVPGSAPPVTSDGGGCVVCLALGMGGAKPSGAAEAPLLAQQAVGKLSGRDVFTAFGWGGVTPQARGPPLAVA